MFYSLKLKSLRDRKGLTQQNIADILDLNLSTYAVYEIEMDIIPIKHLNTLCNYFDVSIDYVFGFSDERQYIDNRKEVDTKLSGSRLKSFRNENKLTQGKLGEVLNCSYGTIAGYESGRYMIATSFLYDICSTYKISADYLLGKVDNPMNLKNDN